MFFLKIVFVFLLLCSSQISASPNERNSAFLRAHLRQKAESTVARINQIQQKWTAKLNPRFAEMTDDELKGMLGVVDSIESREEQFGSKAMDLKEWREIHTQNSEKMMAKEAEEDHFDARKEWPECAEIINKIQDQSQCGSCWAVSSASVMQDRICIGSGGKVQVDISAEDIMSCTISRTAQGCDGGLPENAFGMWQSVGYCTGSDYAHSGGCKPYPFPPNSHELFPYSTRRCQKKCENANYTKSYEEDKYYGKQPVNLKGASEEDIKKAIREGGPVVAIYQVYKDFIHYHSGVYEHTEGAKYIGLHAVRVVGWGVENGTTPYWLIANSYNVNWGEQGWFKIVRGQNECDIEKRSIDFGFPKI